MVMLSVRSCILHLILIPCSTNNALNKASQHLYMVIAHMLTGCAEDDHATIVSISELRM